MCKNTFQLSEEIQNDPVKDGGTNTLEDGTSLGDLYRLAEDDDDDDDDKSCLI